MGSDGHHEGDGGKSQKNSKFQVHIGHKSSLFFSQWISLEFVEFAPTGKTSVMLY